MTIDKRVIWKDKSDLEMMIEIKNFIANHGISSVREYQRFKKKYPNDVPGLWVIQQRFDSWEKMLVCLGNKVFDRYRWAQYSDEELKTLVEAFIKENGVYSQRKYERVCGVNNMPSLSTLKKRYEDVRFLFRKSKSPDYVTDFNLLLRLKNEIIRLDMVDHLSMTYFREHYDRTYG